MCYVLAAGLCAALERYLPVSMLSPPNFMQRRSEVGHDFGEKFAYLMLTSSIYTDTLDTIALFRQPGSKDITSKV